MAAATPGPGQACLGYVRVAGCDPSKQTFWNPSVGRTAAPDLIGGDATAEDT